MNYLFNLIPTNINKNFITIKLFLQFLLTIYKHIVQKYMLITEDKVYDV